MGYDGKSLFECVRCPMCLPPAALHMEISRLDWITHLII